MIFCSPEDKTMSSASESEKNNKKGENQFHKMRMEKTELQIKIYLKQYWVVSCFEEK